MRYNADAQSTDGSLKRKGAATTQRAGKKPAASKAAKDPNKPKRAPSAFFVFMEDFRQQFKQKHPNNKSVAVVGKAGGEKWKSLSDAEKAPYIAIAEMRKEEYNKKMIAYNNKTANASKATNEDESDKSKSEINDEDDESGEEDED